MTSRQRLLIALSLFVAACTSTPVPLPTVVPTAVNSSTPASTTSQATPSATPTSAPTYADRIRIGIVNPGRNEWSDFGPTPLHIGNLTHFFFPTDGEIVTHFLFRALYRLDSVLTPVPDLAAAPCETSDNDRTVTCTLLPATFADGSPLTADDVKFTFDLAYSDVCPIGQVTTCWGDPADKVVSGVEVVDPLTVRFSLSRVDPTFITTILPGLYIESKKNFASQFAAFHAAVASVGSAALREHGDDLNSSIMPNDATTCQSREADAQAFAAAAGIELADKRNFRVGPAGTLDAPDALGATSAACAWLELARDSFYGAADSVDAEGMDAEAIAYGLLPLQWHPLGAGAWRLDEADSVPGDHLVLEASPTADPQPATRRIEFISYQTRAAAAAAMQTGAIDWLPSPWDESPQIIRDLETTANTTTITYAQPANWTEIDFNVRSGQLFSDPNLRRALSLCIDRPAAVNAATDGAGAPAASVLGSQFWAADPALPLPARDVATAKGLIEASGWKLEGGTYGKDGKLLAADIWARSEFLQRVKLAELVAAEAADCGMKLTVKTAPGDKLIRSDPGDHPIWRWPNHPPDSDQPYDLFLIGTVAGAYPDPGRVLQCFKSDEIDTKQNPDGCNNLGYSNAQVDDLLNRADATLDVPIRAGLYRQALDILADELPQLPLFYPLNHVALRSGLTSLAGPLELDKPGWSWQLESLVLEQNPQ